MRFVVDAQLPIRLSRWFRESGFDCIHTMDLPDANKTTDDSLREISLSEGRIVVTKDSDFFKSFILKGIPPKLILVTTGNITNDRLMKIFTENEQVILSSIEKHDVVEVGSNTIIAYQG